VVISNTFLNQMLITCSSQRGFLTHVAAEARAVIRAIRLCKEGGFTRIHLEGDAKGIVDAVMRESPTYSGLGPLVDDIRVLL
jgi:ribonuclease HI